MSATVPFESPPLPSAEPADTSPVPAFIKAVAFSSSESQTRRYEHHDTAHHQNRDPSRALGCLRSGATRTSPRRSACAWPAADEAESFLGGLATFPELEVEKFTEGTAYLEHRNGAEHDAFFDPATGRVIKLTQPGEFGAWGGLVEYVQRLAWVNEFFGDDMCIEGWLRYPNEPAPRLVTSQPWYRVNPARPEPTLAEIDAYIWRSGWLKAYDGAWIHAQREIVVSDALAKNFVLDVAGHVHPIDLIILAPDDEQWECLQNMVRDHPQHALG